MRTIANEIVPVLCGSAFKNKGVQAMLDAVVHYLPSPLDIPDVIGTVDEASDKQTTRAPSDDAPFLLMHSKLLTIRSLAP